MKTLTPRLVVAALGASIFAAGAHATSPEGGTIGKAAPKVTWSGSVTSGASHWVWSNGNPSAPCQSGQTCDSFALKVADDGEVHIKLRNDGTSGTSSGANGAASIRVTLPDGSVVHTSGESGPKVDLLLKIPGAKAGDYTVDGSPSFLNGGTFKADALWFPVGGAPKPAPAGEPEPGTTPQPTQPATGQPGGGAQPAPAAESFTLDGKAGKVSAKKAKKGKTVSVAVTTSRAVEEVTATLKKGSKVLGTGKVAPFPGKGAVKVKLAKALKKGSYTITLLGRDKSVQVERTIKVKVSK